MGRTQVEADLGEAANRPRMNALARSVLLACWNVGVTEFVVCAGARNAPLVGPLAKAGGLGSAVRVRSFSEERSAAFFALGRARALGEPVAVVTTSGTAVAELLPAVVEAHYQGVPLLALSADRPKTFRGTGAPQAIEQPGIFGRYVGYSVDIDESGPNGDCLAEWDQSGPAHLNVCLPEPAAGDCETTEQEIASLFSSRHRQSASEPLAENETLERFLDNKDSLLVLLGEIPAKERLDIRDFLRRLGAPILAEATSGLREDPELQFLMIRAGGRSALSLSPDRILRIGGVPVWRLWRDLESRPGIPVLSVSPTRLPGLARPSEVVQHVGWESVKVSPRTPPDLPHRPLEDMLDRFLRSECALVGWLSRVIPESSAVFLGNSLPIREWNLAAAYEDRGLQCFANRGANGIDGVVSTALGIGADTEEMWILIGDLTALYDLAALWVLPQLSCRRVRVVVVNNGGGRIFSRLPALRETDDTAMQVIENRHEISFQHWAGQWGAHYTRVQETGPLDLPDGPVVLEVVPDATESEAFWSEWEKC